MFLTFIFFSNFSWAKATVVWTRRTPEISQSISWTNQDTNTMTWSLICSSTLEPFLSFWLRQFHLSLAILDLEMAFGRLHQLFLPSAFPIKPSMTHHLCHSILITRDNHEDNFGTLSQGYFSFSSFILVQPSHLLQSETDILWDHLHLCLDPSTDTIWFLF